MAESGLKIGPDGLYKFTMTDPLGEFIMAAPPGEFPVTLDLEAIRRIAVEFERATNRAGKFYVIEAKHLPDDAIGVIYMRPEDAKKFKSLRTAD